VRMASQVSEQRFQWCSSTRRDAFSSEKRDFIQERSDFELLY
jgi:hypothetical protein